MKSITTLLLGLLALAIPAACDDWLYRRCACANSQTVGYLLFAKWTNPTKSYTWYKLRRTARFNEPATLFSKRCAVGSNTVDCIDIPDAAKYLTIYDEANPWNVGQFCETYGDGVETCALAHYLEVGKQRREWKSGGVESVMDCEFECKTLWAPKNDTIAFDLCSHSTRGGDRISTRMKEKKNGKIRVRGGAWMDCYEFQRRNWHF